MSSNDEPTDVQLDISEYEGHTEGKWDIDVNCNLKVNDDEVIGTVEICFPERPNDEADSNGYETSMNYKLIADAPLLLEEVKRLRNKIRLLDIVEDRDGALDHTLLNSGVLTEEELKGAYSDSELVRVEFHN